MRRSIKRGQVWSMDLIIAVIIFLLAIGIFYFFAGANNSESSSLQIESKLVADKIGGDDSASIVNGTSIDDEKLKMLATMSYEDLKKELGIKNNFCIILRDKEGNIIPVLVQKNPSEIYKVAIGNPELNITINGISVQCGEELTYEEIQNLVS